MDVEESGGRGRVEETKKKIQKTSNCILIIMRLNLISLLSTTALSNLLMFNACPQVKNHGMMLVYTQKHNQMEIRCNIIKNKKNTKSVSIDFIADQLFTLLLLLPISSLYSGSALVNTQIQSVGKQVIQRPNTIHQHLQVQQRTF